MPQKQTKKPAFTTQKSLRNTKINEFSIIDKFKYGYRNREDQTNLPAGVLVKGSKNVLTNVSERIQCRKGYVLDGSVSSTITPITSSYTLDKYINFERNLRSYSPTSTTGKLEYRYIDPTTSAVSWRTLLSSLTSTAFNYTTWWYELEKQGVILAVNGTANIYEWSGAIAVASTNTANTITKTGTTTWKQEGFYNNNTDHPTRAITINGTSYTYTGGENTTTLTGLSADPTADIAADPIVHQTPIVKTSFTELYLDKFDLIETYGGHLFLGSFSDHQVYVSKIGNTTTRQTYYTDFTQSSINARGYGTTLFLDAPPKTINTLENSITISAGKNQWYQTQLTQGLWTDNINPAAPVEYKTDIWTTNRLKTNANQAAQSQAMVSAMKNDLIFISNEPTLDRLGRVEQILGSTQATNISDSIKLDFDNYDFTDASIFYNKYFIYIAVPKSGLVLIYNIVRSYWEAPQTIPISRFYTVDGELYGHSYYTPESYKLFSGNADRVDPVTNPLGNPINSKVVFSYINYGSPSNSKNFNKFYVEGYIGSNTNLKLGIKYDIDGCAIPTEYIISGSNPQYVCLLNDNSSLGKSSLGKNPLGGNLNSQQSLPPKFRVIKTFPKNDFFEVQYSFETIQTNSNWEILRFGCALEFSPTIPTNIIE